MYHKEYSAVTGLIVIYTSQSTQLQFKIVSKILDTSYLAITCSLCFVSALKWKSSAYMGSIWSQTYTCPE